MTSSPLLSLVRSRSALTRIGVGVLGCILIAALYAVLAPKWYRSTLTVVATKQSRGSSIAGLLGGELAGLAAGFDVGGGGSDAPRIAAVLQSVVVTDAIIEKFKLREHYDERYLETARDELWRRCIVKVLSKPSLVQLTCEDHDPRLVQSMLEYFAEIGNQVFQRVNASSASEEVRFLEKRVAELEQKAEDSAARMRSFQELHGIVDLEAQSKALVSAMSTLNALRTSKQLELDFARTYSSSDEATTRQLESQLMVMDEKLRKLEASGQPSAQGVSGRQRRTADALFPMASEVPRLRAEYEALYRNRKVSEATLVITLDRLEAARASEARDVSTFTVLDPPTLATRPVRPRPLRTIAIGCVVGMLLGFGFEWFRSAGSVEAGIARLVGSAERRTG